MVTLRGPWEKDRISFYTLGLTFLIFDLELLLIFPFLFSIPLGTKYTFLSAEIFLILLGLDFFYELYNEIIATGNLILGSLRDFNGSIFSLPWLSRDEPLNN